MRKLWPCVAFLSAWLVTAAASAQDNPPPKKKNKVHNREATAQDYTALAKLKTTTGRLISIDGSQQMTLKVEFQQPELKDNAAGQKLAQAQIRQQQQAMREYMNIQRIRNPWVRDQRLQQLQARLQAQQASAAFDPRNSPFRTVTASVSFKLPTVENPKVARANLETEYDDKGQVIDYTKEELKKKRDPDMPGYTAKIEDLQAGQLVTVYLGKAKKPAKAKDKEAGDKPEVKDKEKAKEAADPEDNRPEVRMILIVAEADPSTLPRDPGKDKKKKNQ
jgi:hypothetical protein